MLLPGCRSLQIGVRIMDKKSADILKKLSPFTAEELKVVDELIATEKLRSDAKKEDSAKPRKPNSSFTIVVDDNFHFMDEDARYTYGEFDTWEEAVAKAKKMVDYDIVSAIESGSTPEEAIDLYQTFGEDPSIIGDGDIPDDDFFSVWTYAESRARELYELKQRPRKTGRPRRVGRPTKERTITAKQAADKLMGSLVKNLNANVMKEEAANSVSTQDINKNEEKSE
jgi:hypothetical protein